MTNYSNAAEAMAAIDAATSTDQITSILKDINSSPSNIRLDSSYLRALALSQSVDAGGAKVVALYDGDIVENINGQGVKTYSGVLASLISESITLVSILIIFLISANGYAASNFERKVKTYSKKECLSLTEKDQTYDNATKRLLKLKIVKEFNSLLAASKDKVSMMFFYSEARYINSKCFWYIRIEEDHQTHLAFWKAFLVDIDGTKIYEEDQADDTYHIIN